ncbi:MAG: glycosyltransferase family 2 protein [Polyangia bacterium]|jgi:glycosyltransferase involved in cell wall biosynthesis|nr:glycosyltransferase family 2 protein [Polyangia bacterium]
MFRNLSLAIVVPARNESSQLGGVLGELPAFVDRIFVVDDASTDDTRSLAQAAARSDPRLRLLEHSRRRGVGGAISTGYAAALAEGFDLVAVLAGDGQMDPADLPALLGPLVEGRADYVKGNRFTFPGGLARIPGLRRAGGFLLSALTKIVTGYWHVSDSQCGYTAITREALATVDLERLYKGYGVPNDLLARLNAAEMRVAEVPVVPRYGVGERSKMRIPGVVLPILFMLWRAFVRRLWQRYMLSSGHPVVFVYLLSFLSLTLSTGLGIYILARYLATGWVMKAALIVGTAAAILGVQLLVSGFSMDQEANRHLCVRLPPRGRANEPPLTRGDPPGQDAS